MRVALLKKIVSQKVPNLTDLFPLKQQRGPVEMGSFQPLLNTIAGLPFLVELCELGASKTDHDLGDMQNKVDIGDAGYLYALFKSVVAGSNDLGLTFGHCMTTRYWAKVRVTLKMSSLTFGALGSGFRHSTSSVSTNLHSTGISQPVSKGSHVLPLHTKNPLGTHVASQPSKVSLTLLPNVKVSKEVSDILHQIGSISGVSAAIFGLFLNIGLLIKEVQKDEKSEHRKALCVSTEQSIYICNAIINLIGLINLIDQKSELACASYLLMTMVSSLTAYKTSQAISLLRHRHSLLQENRVKVLSRSNLHMSRISGSIETYSSHQLRHHYTGLSSAFLTLFGAFIEAFSAIGFLPKEGEVVGWVLMGLGTVVGMGVTLVYLCDRYKHRHDQSVLRHNIMLNQMVDIVPTIGIGEMERVYLPLSWSQLTSIQDRIQTEKRLAQLSLKHLSGAPITGRYYLRSRLEHFYSMIMPMRDKVTVWERTFRYLNKSVRCRSVLKNYQRRFQLNDYREIPVSRLFSLVEGEVVDCFYKSIGKSYRPWLKRYKHILDIVSDKTRVHKENRALERSIRHIRESPLSRLLKDSHAILSYPDSKGHEKLAMFFDYIGLGDAIERSQGYHLNQELLLKDLT